MPLQIYKNLCYPALKFVEFRLQQFRIYYEFLALAEFLPVFLRLCRISGLPGLPGPSSRRCGLVSVSGGGLVSCRHCFIFRRCDGRGPGLVPFHRRCRLLGIDGRAHVVSGHGGLAPGLGVRGFGADLSPGQDYAPGLDFRRAAFPIPIRRGYRPRSMYCSNRWSDR